MRKGAPFLALLLMVVFCVLFAPASFAVATDQTPTDIPLTGVAITTSAASASGNTFTNTGYEFVEVVNADAAQTVVTIDVYPSGGQGSPQSLTVTDPTVTVAAGATKKIGPFRKRLFNNGSEKVTLTFSNVTSVTVGVYRLTPNP